MDFDKRLEAAELMWKLLGLTSSDPVLALNIRCLRLVTRDVTGDNQLLRGDTGVTQSRDQLLLLLLCLAREERK